jgi:signal transduction histidine kinase
VAAAKPGLSMNEGGASPGRHWTLPGRAMAAGAVLLAMLAVAADLATWIELNVAIVYGLPLVLAAASGSRLLLWLLTLLLVCATFLVYFLQAPPGSANSADPFLVDRALAALSIFLVAGLLHALSRATDALEARSRALDRQNRLLAAVNEELSRQQEEVSRRNEELDTQRAAAEEASGRKTRLLMSVSHDIRTPLTTINVMADLIRTAAEDPALLAKLPALTQNLQSNARALSSMVTDVLDISYLESGRIELRDSEFCLDDILAEECESMHALAAAKGLRLAHEPADAPVWLRADRVKLGRVLRNLVNNAIQFTERGGVTLRSTRPPGGGVEIHVVDTGMGIDSKDLERIFAESARLRRGSSGGDGWGLGLPICRRLTRLMGGDVVVESNPGHGSDFIVKLPQERILERTGSHNTAKPGE